MKKGFCISAILISLLLGAARTADLFWNTDPATGFLLSGSVPLRYLLLVPALAAACLTGLCVPRGQPCGLREREAGMWMGRGSLLLPPLAFCSEVYGFLTVLNTLSGAPVSASRHHAQDLPGQALRQAAQLTRAALFVLFGVWCLLLFLENRARKRRGGMLYLGVAGSAAFYLHTVVRFIEQPASLYRILPAVEIFSALAALLFVTALLRALYLPEGGTAPALCRWGLVAFFFCTCLALPQALWQWAAGVTTPVSLPLAVTLGGTGLLGACCAWSAAAWDGAAQNALPAENAPAVEDAPAPEDMPAEEGAPDTAPLPQQARPADEAK